MGRRSEKGKVIPMTKRKLRFNPVDALILAVIAAAVVLVVFLFGGGSDAEAVAEAQNTTAAIEYVIEIKEVDSSIRRSLAAGQPVEDAVTRRQIGELKAFSETPMEMAGFHFADDEEIYSEMDGMINVLLTVKAQAEESDAAFTVDGYEIRVGKQISVILPEFQGYGYCVSLTKLG